MINVTVSNRVYYVSNEISANNAAGGDGRSTNAFDTLAAADTAAAANDTIFVFSGISATTPLTGGIALKNGQKLLGQGVALTFPVFGTIVAAGSQPLVQSPADTITVLANTANGDRTGIEIRGLDLESTAGNAIDVTSAEHAEPRRADQREHHLGRGRWKASTSTRARPERPRSTSTATRSPPRAPAST